MWLPHHRRNIEKPTGGRTYPTFRSAPTGMAQSIVGATPIGYEDFQVLVKRGVFNPVPVAHIETFLKHLLDPRNGGDDGPDRANATMAPWQVSAIICATRQCTDGRLPALASSPRDPLGHVGTGVRDLGRLACILKGSRIAMVGAGRKLYPGIAIPSFEFRHRGNARRQREFDC
jgi:hypothetical protein